MGDVLTGVIAALIGQRVRPFDAARLMLQHKNYKVDAFSAAVVNLREGTANKSSGGNDLLQITGLNIRLDSKLRNDSGTGTANSGDSGGTVVNFNLAFVDVDSISVTPLATSAVIAVYDFVDAPNPTSFKVLLFNTSGTRVSGSFSWNARGV